MIQSLNIKEWKLLELQITETRHPLSISDGKTALKLLKYLSNVQKKKVHMFNVWTVMMQSLNNKEGKLFELDITQIRHHLGILIKKCLSSRPPKMKSKLWNVHKIGCTNLQCVNNHYAKFEYKGMNTIGITDYTN